MRAAAVFSPSSVGSDAAAAVSSALGGGNSIGLSVSEAIASMSEYGYGKHQCQNRASANTLIRLYKILNPAEDLE